MRLITAELERCQPEHTPGSGGRAILEERHDELSHLLSHLESTQTQSVHWPTTYYIPVFDRRFHSTCGRLSEEYDCLLQYLGRTSRPVAQPDNENSITGLASTCNRLSEGILNCLSCICPRSNELFMYSLTSTLLYVPCGAERECVRVRIFTCMTTWGTIHIYTLFLMGYNTASGSSVGSAILPINITSRAPGELMARIRRYFNTMM